MMVSKQQHQRRIGLLLASMHTGSSISLWREMAKHVAQSNESLFVFAGGRLESPEGQEYLRNAIYPLANRKNIDALISWSSALGGYVSPQEVLAFLDGLDPMPIVSIGIKKNGSPSVSFDAYGGIQSLVLHCISRHNAKRIAFIRGPENHYSAQDRWRAYCDALGQAGIAQDTRLISDPMAWTEGAKAVDQLVVERGLIPGLDFDTLVCSSDMMMFAASKRLEALGYTVAKDFRIVGYNDSRESRLLRVPATTSRMPVVELAQVSFSLLMNLMDGKGSANLDVMLPSHPVIRRSCGCRYSLGTVEQARHAVGEVQHYIAWLIQALSLNEREASELRRIISSPPMDEAAYLPLLEALVYRYLDNDGDSNLLSEALFFYCEFFGSPAFREGAAHAIGELFLRQRDLVSHEHAYELAMQGRRLDELNGELLSLRSLDAIPLLLQQYLVELGIGQGYLVLHTGESSLFIGGYDGAQHFPGQTSFDKDLLLPEPINQALPKAIYVVEPLYMENQPLGYLVLGTTRYSGSLMEDIRSAVSSAIKGALLLSSANRAAEEAERATTKRDEFFANIGEGLKAPLEEIALLLQREGHPASEEVRQRVAHASHLLELSLSFSGELELEEVTCDLSTLIGGPPLPIVIVDPARIAQVIKIITAYIGEHGEGATTESEVSPQGLGIIVSSTRESWKAELGGQDPGLLLAQKIVIQSGGSVSFADNAIRLMLPWPTLQGRGAFHGASRIAYLASPAEEEVPPAFSQFPDVALVHPLSMKGVQLEKLGQSVLAWDGRRDSAELTLLLHQMSRHPQLAHAPMICIGADEGHQSLFFALTAAKSVAGEEQVLLLVGSVESHIAEELGMGDQCIRATASEAVGVLRERSVSLVISAEADVAFCHTIRAVSRVPIVIIKSTWSREEVDEIALITNLIIAHPHMSESRPFLVRLAQLGAGQGTLPPLTGILAKRTVAYFDVHAHQPISRWQVAEAVHVSEDYLSRIFHKEMGLSPWEYLSHHRIARAVELLKQQTYSINEVASRVGFSDQAYFCRVFRKIKGFAPSKMHKGR
ncbi:MAG: helix-turn-helix domain-containing protein [Sphaerochaeta sp.]|jgi:DNA-binding LacI/PurR family transcriptional regulator/AraC-like DNA-binding protein|nr:helix-turn-helix domain-containing protein [Sphaerochaeta sp.]